MENKKDNCILIVDDNEINRRILQQMMIQLSYECECAIDGHDAVKKAQENEFCLIIMDIAMPGMDGLEATRIIRNRSPINRNTPIIALTASGSDDIEAEAFRSGMDAYYQKPIFFDDLKKVTQKFIPEKNAVLSESSIT